MKCTHSTFQNICQILKMDTEQHVENKSPANKNVKSAEIKIDKPILQCLSGLISNDPQVRISRATNIIHLLSKSSYENVSSICIKVALVLSSK